MKKKGLAFEFNAASLRRKETLDYHPSKDIREVLFKEGIRIVTIGSDAHSAGSVGSKCVEARGLAKAEGFKTAFFKNRKPVYY
jgi:histidinol phosphatase-like PHP family hydrolase